MASFIRLLLAATETGVLVNTDNVTCILAEGGGSRIFFVTDEDTVDVATPFAELSVMLGTGDPTSEVKDNATPPDAAPKVAPAASGAPASVVKDNATPPGAAPKVAPATNPVAGAGGPRERAARPSIESPAALSPAVSASKTDGRPR